MKYLQYEPLKQAAKALERAAEAAINATLTPNRRPSPCDLQMSAARAEVNCALELIKQADYGGTD
jgi:hypothetical protein